MLILAHRGASADAPENTLSAFSEAVAQGADGVELDVMRCASGELVVCHDEVLTRLAGLPWDVRTTAYWKLRRADVGSRLGYAPERIPLLEEVVDLLPARLFLNLELKCETVDDGGLTQALGDFVRARGLGGRTLISSFNPFCLFRLAKSHPELRRGQLIDPDKRWWVQSQLLTPLLSPYSIHPYARDCTPQRLADWRARGFQLVVWTVDDPAEARRLRDEGVDMLITNRPGALRSALEGSGQKSRPSVAL